MSRTVGLATSGIILALVSGQTAQAQTADAQAGESMFRRDRNLSVMERPRPEFSGSGVQQGALIYTPSLTLGLEFNDNIFATSSNEESDVIGIFNPAIGVETTWSRHALAAQASVTRREYADFGDESVWNAEASALGRLDIVRGTFIEGNVGFADRTEPRTSAGAAGQAAEPIDYNTTDWGVHGQRELGRTRFDLGVDSTSYDYDDARLFGGGIADQDYRDRDETVLTARGDVAVSPDTSLFARGRIIDRDYDLDPPAVAQQRSSDGYVIDAGTEFDIGGVARGSVAVGYMEQDYEDPALEDGDGFSTDLIVDWFPTQLTTVSFNASRVVNDSAIAGSGGFLGTNFGVNVDHELRRNLILSAAVGWGNDDYFGIDREDSRWSLTGSATWFVNRHAGVRASLVHTDQDSKGLAGNQDFASNIVAVSLVLRP